MPRKRPCLYCCCCISSLLAEVSAYLYKIHEAAAEAVMQPPSELICLGLLSTSLWKVADVGIIMMSRWVQCRAWPGGGSCSPLEPRRINARLDSNQLCACKWSRLIMTSVDLKENTLNQPNKNTRRRHPLTATRLCQTPIYLSHKE